MKIDAGALDRRITILTEALPDRNAVGERVTTWIEGATIAAQRLELRSADVARMAGKDTTGAARYLVRWRDNLAVNDRVRIEGADWRIAGIDEPDRRTTLVLSVEAV